MNKTYRTWLIIVVLSLIWSSSWLAIKIGLENIPPFLGAAWRFLIAFIFLAVYAWKLKLPFEKKIKDHLFFIFFGFIIFTGSYALVYWGEQYISSGLASVLFSIMPFYVAVMSIKMLPSEKVTFKKMAGITIGFIGILVIFKDQLEFSGGMALWGMAAISLSPGLSAFATILGKKARDRFHSVTLNTYPLFYTSITFFAMHFIFESGMPVTYSWSALISFLYLGIFGTAVAFVLYFWLLKTTSAVLMSLITFITPPLALVWGWMVLDEKITVQLIIGMLIIFSGIAIVKKT